MEERLSAAVRMQIVWKFFCFFLSPTQTRRQHIQGCSIIHVRGSSPSPFSSHPTRLTRPSQYYQEDVCLHGSDSERENSSQGSDDCHSFEGQGAQNTSRGHSNTRFNEWPGVRWADGSHGRGNACSTAQGPGGRLSQRCAHRTAHSTKGDFHSSLSSFSGMHAAARQREREHSRERPCHRHYLCSPSLWVMEREPTQVWMLNGKAQRSEKDLVSVHPSWNIIFVSGLNNAPDMYSLLKSMYSQLQLAHQ